MDKIKIAKQIFILVVVMSTGLISVSFAKDTDIYNINTKQNCYILMDDSGSMDFGVYESTIDYGAMFDYLFTLNDDGNYSDYIYDEVNHSNYFYENHYDRTKIFLTKGKIGISLATVNGSDMAFTGDAADPEYLWYTSDMVDTHTVINTDGTLSDDGTGNQRITLGSDGYILFDGTRLPLGLDIKLTENKELYDGSVINNGFGGLLNAPGYYCSGYEGISDLNVAEDGDDEVYFFITGNWMNMQAMYNLQYTTNNPEPKDAKTGDMAWKYELFPVSQDNWSQISYDLDYPEGDGNYEDGLSENETEQIISHPGAEQIQVHFSHFDVDGDDDSSDWSYDYVVLKDGSGNAKAYYDNDNNPASGDGWSATIDDDTVKVCLQSDAGVNKTGYTIDKIRVTYHMDSYLMQNRLDVAKDAMLYALEEFHGKMNWGFASFQYNGTSGDGANLMHALNPNLTDDENTASIRTHVEYLKPMYGTPMGEALQDVFEMGYYTKRHALDNLLCRKNYIISISDGFPSDDGDWSRIGGVTFSDFDGDGWTADPYQYSAPDDNYYDDVAEWLYTHSWLDKAEVTDPANSYVNVTTHHIAFGAKQPLMMDAASQSGGEYITAYNKSQLVAAFYALALQMTEAISFTSPVVSIDAANKIQNGDDLYLGLFLPQDNKSWMGNIKKFRLGNKDSEDLWMIYDGGDNEAVSEEGEFLDNTSAFWGDDEDANDSDNYGVADVTEDGVGEVLLERILADFSSADYYERTIKTYDVDNVELGMYDVQGNVTFEDLGVSDVQARNELVNYIYGYTNEADAATGNPLAARGWILGSIVHSRPLVIDYYTSDSVLDKRYVAVGANDGMLHVFNDADGKEVLAFIPSDILPELKRLPEESLVDTVDGFLKLYRKNNNPKYLIFGERRGGENYWCLDIQDSDPSKWSVKWVYSNSEISQSWSDPQIASVPISIDTSTGEHTFQDVMILSGGYDAEEDNYPEPFDDIDNSGTPYTTSTSTTIDNSEWDKNDRIYDINGNKVYDLYNLDKNESGRGIFIVDIDDPTNEIYSVSYDSTGSAVEQAMKWCFPATPSIVTTTYSYRVNTGTETKIQIGVIKAIYATDIYANLYKIKFNFEVEHDSSANTWSVLTAEADRWSTEKIFSGNPGSSGNTVNGDGEFSKGAAATNQGLKTFYSPAVSWRGACDYFDAGNYHFSDTRFNGLSDIAGIYFGTGDREHPTYTMKQNRFYAVYDDSSVSAYEVDSDGNNIGDITVSTYPYSEIDLLNLSCNELDDGTTLAGVPDKNDYRIALRDDPVYNGGGSLEESTNEDDSKGWYIVLDDQGDTTECSHCTYAASDADENHDWEKVLSRVQLFAGILYFTTYQPAIEDICNPHGNGFAYSLNYCDGTAAYDLNLSNNTGDGSEQKDVTDRYFKVTDIFGVPSYFSIIIRDGTAGAMSMMGGKIIGPQGGNEYKIKSPGFGLDFYYWLEGKTIE